MFFESHQNQNFKRHPLKLEVVRPRSTFTQVLFFFLGPTVTFVRVRVSGVCGTCTKAGAREPHRPCDLSGAGLRRGGPADATQAQMWSRESVCGRPRSGAWEMARHRDEPERGSADRG